MAAAGRHAWTRGTGLGEPLGELCVACVSIPLLRAWGREGASACISSRSTTKTGGLGEVAKKLGLADAILSSRLELGNARRRWSPPGLTDSPPIPGKKALLDGERRLRCVRSGAVHEDEKGAFLSLMRAL